MTYEELKKALQEWTEKVLKTKAYTNDYTKDWFVDTNRMIDDITRIIKEGFI